MTEIISYIGALLVMLSAYLIGREYSLRIKKRLAETEGFCLLIAHIEGVIDKFMSYGDELYSGFTNGALSECGFLDRLKGGASISELVPAIDCLSVSQKVKDILKELFTKLGGDYRDLELKRIGELKGRINELYKCESEELNKSLKITRALLLGGGLVIVILGI